jgi:hypothetical protein
MRRYTSSQARQNFAAVLEQARREGAVRIERRDGQAFVIIPDREKRSPLDVKGISLDPPITREEILQVIREGRERYG